MTDASWSNLLPDIIVLLVLCLTPTVCRWFERKDAELQAFIDATLDR